MICPLVQLFWGENVVALDPLVIAFPKAQDTASKK